MLLTDIPRFLWYIKTPTQITPYSNKFLNVFMRIWRQASPIAFPFSLVWIFKMKPFNVYYLRCTLNGSKTQRRMAILKCNRWFEGITTCGFPDWKFINMKNTLNRRWASSAVFITVGCSYSSSLALRSNPSCSICMGCISVPRRLFTTPQYHMKSLKFGSCLMI